MSADNLQHSVQTWRPTTRYTEEAHGYDNVSDLIDDFNIDVPFCPIL